LQPFAFDKNTQTRGNLQRIQKIPVPKINKRLTFKNKNRRPTKIFHSLQKIGGQPNKNQHFRKIPKKVANREKFAAHKGQKLCNFAYKAELAANQI
jgi:hypothetical protein